MTLKTLPISPIVLALLLAACTATSGQTPSAPAPQAQSQSASPSTPAPSPPFGSQFKKTVGLLRVGSVDQRSHIQRTTGGTAFFVSYPDTRLGKDQGFMYLVTNRHVVQPGIEEGNPDQVEWMTLRFNTIDADQASVDEALPAASAHGWHFSMDRSVDLAVIALTPDPKKYDFVPLPVSAFATRDVVKDKQIAEGDRVLFTGFFYQIPGMKKFEPIVREGILAMIPYEDLETTLRAKGSVYLADVRAFHGNSGSPLLVNVGGLRNGGLMAGYDYRLLGVVSGFYHEDADLKLTIATTLTGTLEENSGIAMIVPADELRKLLDSPDLQAQRDVAVLAVQKPKN
jgi:hypothetical protein